MVTGYTKHTEAGYAWIDHSEYAQNSIEISLTAAGKVTFSVKIYSVDPDEARAIAVTQFQALQERFYPTPAVYGSTLADAKAAKDDDKESKQ